MGSEISLPRLRQGCQPARERFFERALPRRRSVAWKGTFKRGAAERVEGSFPGNRRSEEHTSELQSRVDLVCRLLLEKKKIVGATSSRWWTRRKQFCPAAEDGDGPRRR